MAAKKRRTESGSNARSQSVIDQAISEVAMSTNGVVPTAELPTTIQAPRSPRRIVPGVPIELDRVRTLRMDFEAMDRFQEATGLNAWASEVWARPSPNIVGRIIWAGLLHEDPTLTYEQVRKMPGMEIANYGYLTDVIGELWGRTMPDADQSASASTGESADPNPSPNPGIDSEQ